MVADFLRRDLQRSGLFKAVLPGDSMFPATCVLEGTVEDFYQSEEAHAWEVVLGISVTLVIEGEPDISKRVIFQKTYRGKEICGEKSPGALAPAMSKVMARVSEEIMADAYDHLKGKNMNPVLLELGKGIPGYEQFIGVWYLPGDLKIIVDVGPSRSAGDLIRALEDEGVEEVDYVLLTHIHIDHAGGLGDFLNRFPKARVICHEKAVAHMVDPEKLWQGSRKVLGEIADAYGPLKPVSPERLIPHKRAHLPGLEIIETPGHAVHHISFIYGGCLFAGEAGGNYFVTKDYDYLRPATPPVFFLNTSLKSVDLLLGRDDQPIFYSHFGHHESSRDNLNRFRRQLVRWEEIISRVCSGHEEDLLGKCVETILDEDPDLGAFEMLEPAVRKRETFFMANSIKGYLGYLKSRG